MRKLFLLEDDLSLISGLTFAFKKQGFALDTARTLAEAEVLWSDRKYDLLVLDVSLPDGSGFDFCQKVRRSDVSRTRYSRMSSSIVVSSPVLSTSFRSVSV